MQANVKFVGSSVKDSGSIEVQETHSANIVCSLVLIEHGELKEAVAVSLHWDSKCLVPYNLSVLLTIHNFCLKLGDVVSCSDEFDPNKVFHLSESIIVLLQSCIANGHFYSGHILS